MSEVGWLIGLGMVLTFFAVIVIFGPPDPPRNP